MNSFFEVMLIILFICLLFKEMFVFDLNVDFQVLSFFVTCCQQHLRSARQTGCRIRSLYIQGTFSMCVCAGCLI